MMLQQGVDLICIRKITAHIQKQCNYMNMRLQSKFGVCTMKVSILK